MVHAASWLPRKAWWLLGSIREGASRGVGEVNILKGWIGILSRTHLLRTL